MIKIIFLLSLALLISIPSSQAQTSSLEDFNVIPVFEKYENSEAGLIFTFPEYWLGLEMNVEGDPYVFVVPVSHEIESEEPSMILIIVADTSPLIAEDFSLEDEPCEVPSTASIVQVQQMKAMKMFMDCQLPGIPEPLEFLVYGFLTHEKFIVVGYASLSEISYEYYFTEFEEALDNVTIENPIDLSDPYYIVEGSGFSAQGFEIQMNGERKEIIFSGSSQISEFSFSENPASISFTPLKTGEFPYESLSIYINDTIDAPYSIQIDGDSYEDFLVVTDETTGNIGIGIEYKFPVNKISISGTAEKQDSFAPNIPDWIRGNAGWWAQGAISDAEFVSGIQYMIKEGIISIPETSKTESGGNSKEIPSWIKNNADWWSQGLITDNDFVKGIQYMVERGIIEV